MIAAAICMDSQSLLKTTQSGSADTAGLRRMLDERAVNRTPCSVSQATKGLLVMRRRMPVLSMRQHKPTVLADQHPPNANGPTAMSLQNTGSAHQGVFNVGRLSGCPQAGCCRDPPPTPTQLLHHSPQHDNRPYMS